MNAGRGTWAVGCGVVRRLSSVVVLLTAFASAPLSAQSADSLLVAAQRIARTWQRHDFGQMLGAGADISVVLPGRQRSAPLEPAQAAELLRGYVEGAHEESSEVVVVRTVSETRAYVEVERIFAPRGTAILQQNTIFVELRRTGAGFHVVEVRIAR